MNTQTPRTLDGLTPVQRRWLEHVAQCADPATGADNSAAMDVLLSRGLIDVDWYGNWYVTYEGKCLLGGVK